MAFKAARDIIQINERYQYTKGALELEQVDPKSPFVTFHHWITHAFANRDKVNAPEAGTLATAELPSGRVGARMVLMKRVDTRGFVVYSNFDTSQKAQALKTNPKAALVFWWDALERQIRIEGSTERLTPEESKEYIQSRPRGAQIGAWASPQSLVITNEELEKKVALKTEEFKDLAEVPIPPFWGGLRIVPDYVEFWQGRANRLHDRIVYKRASESAPWSIERLAP